MARWTVWLCCFWLVGGSTAAAQVNTEGMRSWEKGGVSGHLELAGTWRTGNVDLLELGAGSRVQYASFATETSSRTPVAERDPRDLVYLIASFTFGIRSSARFKNDAFGHLRWTHMFSGWLGTEVFTQIQSSEFIALKQRLLAGGGLRLEPYEAENFEVAVGLGAMLEYERLDVPEGGLDDPETVAPRSTNYLALKFYSDDAGLSFVETVYYQPLLTGFSDYRVLSETELAVAVGGLFTLALSASIRYDSRPPQGIERLDSTVVNRLRFSF